MGVCLVSGKNGEKDMHLSYLLWRRILKIADAYGWEPMGTVDPDIFNEWPHVKEDWPGDYFSNDYQLVTGEDAKNICDALKRALESGELSKKHEEFVNVFLEFSENEDQGFRIS